jgi:DNA-binding MarR family transcriptional regulator
MDPTTLNRNLKPLQRQGLVDAAPDPTDGRARLVRITERGRRRLEKAVPFWQQAQMRVAAALGIKTMSKLNDLLDLSSPGLAVSHSCDDACGSPWTSLAT